MCKVCSVVSFVPHQIALGVSAVGRGIEAGAKTVLWAGREVIWLVGDVVSVCLKLFLMVFYRHYERISVLRAEKEHKKRTVVVTEDELKDVRKSLSPINTSEEVKFNGQDDQKD